MLKPKGSLLKFSPIKNRSKEGDSNWRGVAGLESLSADIPSHCAFPHGTSEHSWRNHETDCQSPSCCTEFQHFKGSFQVSVSWETENEWSDLVQTVASILYEALYKSHSMVDVLKTQLFGPHGAITRLVLFHNWNHTEYWEAWDLKLIRLDVTTFRRCHGLKYGSFHKEKRWCSNSWYLIMQPYLEMGSLLK